MANIEYAIQVYTGSSVTDSDLAMVSGVIGVVTGRPNLSGATWGSNEVSSGIISDVYYNGFLIKDALSNPARQINISKTGDYGNLSSFSFKFNNSELYWNTLNNNNINLINKETKVYTVIDNVFYQIWTGNITQVSRREDYITFSCEDSSAGIHKMMPPNVINEKTVPVILGDNEYIEAVNVTPTGTLLFTNGEEFSPMQVGFVQNHLESGVHRYTNYFVPEYFTTLRDTENIYIRTIFGGQEAGYDNEQLIKLVSISSDGHILGSNIYFTTENDPVYYLKSDALDGTYKAINLSGHEPYWSQTGGTHDQTLYVGLIDTKKIFAGNDTDATLLSDQIYSYSQDTNTYNTIPGKVIDQGSGLYNIIIPNLTLDDQLETYTALDYTITNFDILSYEKDGSGNYTNPTTWSYTDTGFNLNSLTDKDQSSTLDFNINDIIPVIGQDANDFFLRFDIDITSNINSNLGDIYVLSDMMFQPITSGGQVATGISGYCGIVVSPKDKDGNTISWKANSDTVTGIDYQFYNPDQNYGIPTSGLIDVTGSGNWYLNFNVPLEYYDTKIIKNASTTGLTSPEAGPIFQNYSRAYVEQLPYFDASGDYSDGWIADGIKIPDITRTYLEKITNKIEVIIHIHFDDGADPIDYIKVKMNQLLVCYKNSASVKDKIYLKTAGSSSGGVETNSVYGTFKYILESNDGISSSNIDYGNIESQRGSGSYWTVARQITSRKNSQAYLKELCEHSYVALYPNRKGQRTFNAWLDNLNEGTADWSHDNDTIIKDTISDIKKLPIKDVYNDFVVQYNWNAGSEVFDNQIYVTKTYETSFPPYSGDWSSYVGGYNDYNNAKMIWENAASGYLLTNSVVANPKNLQDLIWYNDEATAYNFLDNLVRWTSTQHMTVDYSIPLNSNNINIELTDKVFFKDKLLSNNSNYVGYVDGITYDTKKDMINVSLILENEQYDPAQLITIIETGTASDDIYESGLLANTIIES